MLRFMVLAAMGAGLGWAQADLGEASLEELLNTKITSVSKKEQRLSQAAAVYVINQDDIRRSAATDIPDLLRLVPGVEVARINGNRWAISIRGFNEAYAHEVLVLVDGRSVYSGTFSGVVWDMVGVPLEDIDRIEVIRGPWASVWGANAVNGVINIVTKSSHDTKGGMVNAGGGSSVTAEDTVRYGGVLGHRGSYRVFGRCSRTADFHTPGGANAGDGWDQKQGGFHSDWAFSQATSLSVEGGYFLNHGTQALSGSLYPLKPGQLMNLGFFARGGNIEAQWKLTQAGGAEESLQPSYSSWDRLEQGTPVSDRNVDIEYQNHFHLGDRHDLVAGIGCRRDTGTLLGSSWIQFVPPAKTDNLASAFFQDEIVISPTFQLTIGSKFEHNSYTGFEFEPTLREAWALTPKSTLWAALNRAIAQPGQYETSIQTILGTFPVDSHTTAIVSLSGNPRLKAEELRDFELGYRQELARMISVDLATFVGSYRSLIAAAPLPMKLLPQPNNAQILLPTIIANTDKALSYGGELSVHWDVVERWRLGTSYSLLERSTTSATAGVLPRGEFSTDPRHAFQADSRLNLPGHLEFDQWIWWTSRLAGNAIPSYTRVDVRLGRRLGESAEISVNGQNLLKPRFLEFGDSFGFAGTANPRSIFAKVTWRF